MIACDSCLVPNSPLPSTDSPRAEFFFRKMNGGSQASLVSASDGNFYVLKSRESPQGPNVVFNEGFGSVLAEYLGLPTPLWAPVEVDSKFLAENPTFGFEAGKAARVPAPGLYFGSRFVFAPTDGDMYETVPHGWVDRINDPTLFLRMLLLDLWAENTDRRQALFIESSPRRTLDVVFFDHGHMFGGPYGRKVQRNVEVCLYRHRRVYERALQATNVIEWSLRQMEGIRAKQLRIMMTRLPSEWREVQVEGGVIERLLENQKTIRETANEMIHKLLS